MKEIYVNIHDLIKFKVTDGSSWLSQAITGDLLEEYCNYLSSDSINESDLDFIISITSRLEKKQDCHVLDDEYYLNNGYFFTKDSYKIAKWKIELLRLHNQYFITLHPNLIARLFITGFFIDFLIQFSLTRKGYSIIHSSGLTKNNSSYLFSGRSGSGKTSLSLGLMSCDSSYKFLGDDFQILVNGKSFPYITPLNLFSYNISDYLLARLNRDEKIKMRFKSAIYKLTGGYAKFFTKLNPATSFHNMIGSCSDISKLFIIHPTNDCLSNGIKINKIQKQAAVKYITYNQMMDSRYFPKYLIQYGFMFPNDELSRYWELHMQNLNNNLTNNVEFYLINLPSRLIRSKLALNKIKGIIENA